ncbi:sesquipedalian-1 [Rhinatrema bivittatum]|uniref:sesquipedalian-1 n=1 Tax=Rhinatrema bivittatum TaxID=194408 RepID=UPI001128B418|nr:sesquipedalian-1 [Rhinatrema bivittatum]XP_029427976.1 sesquipedalian-1 [Rhinatrema bivittatum]
MKVNERSLANYAMCGSPAENTGFLYKRGEHNSAYHRRWFVLKGNLLFYFEAQDSREPVGAIVLEGCTVEPCASTEEFMFAIRFEGSKSRTYILVADSQAARQSWVKSLSRANFDYMRLVVKELQLQLEDVEQTLMASCQLQGEAGMNNEGKPVPKSNPSSGGTRRQLHGEPALSGPVIKENGCAVWNNSPGSLSFPKGCARAGGRSLGSTGNCSGSGSEGNLRPPPPAPPRRRPPPSSTGDAAGLSALAMENPVYSGTVCFSKLHDRYSQEIVELRRHWKESQLGKEE